MKTTLIAILAAGDSRRMGRPKLCLPWKSTTVLGHLLSQWREAGAGKILVIHPQDRQSPVAQGLDRLQIAPDERTPTQAPERGMMGSVVTAARCATQIRDLTHLIIALGDQPHLQPDTLRDLLDACETSLGKIIRVVHESKPGHPLALPAELLPELRQTTCATLRDFLGLQNTPVVDLTCRDSGVLLDMDTPEDYARVSHAAGT